MVRVFDYYQALKNLPAEVSNHYWNPTDYLSELDLQIPEELAKKNYQSNLKANIKGKAFDLLDPIDDLFHDINKSYPWEIHVPRRWYNNENDYRLEQLDSMFEKTPKSYTPD
jgi:hypothetical protein